MYGSNATSVSMPTTSKCCALRRGLWPEAIRPERMHDRKVEKTSNTRPVVLSALDVKTGQELYNSGNAMTGWVHFSGLALADGLVFTVDHDSTVYCFGLKGK